MSWPLLLSQHLIGGFVVYHCLFYQISATTLLLLLLLLLLVLLLLLRRRRRREGGGNCGRYIHALRLLLFSDQFYRSEDNVTVGMCMAERRKERRKEEEERGREGERLTNLGVSDQTNLAAVAGT